MSLTIHYGPPDLRPTLTCPECGWWVKSWNYPIRQVMDDHMTGHVPFAPMAWAEHRGEQ